MAIFNGKINYKWIIFMDINGLLIGYPLVICYIKQWKMAIEIVDFPIEHGDFPLLC